MEPWQLPLIKQWSVVGHESNSGDVDLSKAGWLLRLRESVQWGRFHISVIELSWMLKNGGSVSRFECAVVQFKRTWSSKTHSLRKLGYFLRSIRFCYTPLLAGTINMVAPVEHYGNLGVD